MNKKIIIILMIILPLSTFAQRFDGILFFGMAASQVDGDENGGYHKINGTFGINVTHKITKKIEFQTGINYCGKGSRNGPNDNYYLKIALHYVQIPAQLNFNLYKQFTGSAGLYFGYLIKGYNEQTAGSLTEEQLGLYSFEPSCYFALNYPLFDKLTFNFGFSYSLWTIKQSSLWVNNVLTITATYRLSNAS